MALLTTLTTVVAVPTATLVKTSEGSETKQQNDANNAKLARQNLISQNSNVFVNYTVNSNKLTSMTNTPILNKFINFLETNFYFIDLKSAYNDSATPNQKVAIENVATWLGKKGDYTFGPMNINQMVAAATANLPDSVTDEQMNTTILDFTTIQNTEITVLLNATYAKWIMTMEGTENGHQWGFMNPENGQYMFPALVPGTNGLVYDKTDNDMNHPKYGLFNLISRFHTDLNNGKPARFIEPYLNPTTSSDIERTFHDYQTWGKTQFSYYAQQILDQFKTFYYGFADINQSNNDLWSNYLNKETLNPISSIDELIGQWTNEMKDQKWDGVSVLNFLCSTGVWDNLTPEKAADIDTKIIPVEWRDSENFAIYRSINMSTFVISTRSLYEEFLTKRYFGYDDPSSTFNVSQYFSGSPLQIVSEDAFRATFTHSYSTFQALSQFYSWTPDYDTYNFIETEKFNEYIRNQQESLQKDIQSIINIVEDSYYGFGGLLGNRLTTYIFRGIYDLNQQLNAFELTLYYVENLPTTSAEFPGAWESKTIMQELISNPDMGTADWIKDQQQKLLTKITDIVNEVQDRYYGWISKEAGQGILVTSIDRLLVHVEQGTQLTPEEIAATINKTSLPTDVENLWNVAKFLNSINNVDDVNTFLNNQAINIFYQIQRILPLLTPSYFGFNPSSSLVTNSIAQTIMFHHEQNSELTLHDIVLAFKNGIQEQAPGFPQKYAVITFMTQITSDNKDLQAFLDDQKQQIVNQFTIIINRILPSYYGFENLADNPISDYVLKGQTYGEKPDPVALAQFFIDNFQPSQTELQHKWLANGYFQIIIEDGTLINRFLADQDSTLQNKFWQPILEEISNVYFGYITGITSVVTETILLPVKNGEALDSNALLTIFKNNVANNVVNFPASYAVANWFADLISKNKIDGEFGTQEKNALISDIDNSLTQYKNSNWGYNIMMPAYFDHYFLTPDGKSTLPVSDIANNIIFDAKSEWGGEQRIYVFFNSQNVGHVFFDLSVYAQQQTECLKNDLSNILIILNQGYKHKDFTFNQTSLPFAGAEHIWTFFNTKNGSTIGLPTDVDSLYNLFKGQIAETNLVNDKVGFSQIASYLNSLYTNVKGNIVANGELLNWLNWENQ
ncbi:hypothetical protein ASO20_00230 [Mycoplasma sp. (ex Biomphalaria glabrata)]|uniref:hypothetical protein n=1 Tax=Mycoplasma sp. (ex Biomphalaria glabrata) TaxID=1749074 RepID=UPI00073A666D|nr:hypothetical protein [Mycoplasma sp. (ex Biomphalaria glabrata)]ALV23108.1 hypothetical protein ASO20_00230 [Mycoplasma sp. (ex Biomphalaria glabrata)]